MNADIFPGGPASTRAAFQYAGPSLADAPLASVAGHEIPRVSRIPTGWRQRLSDFRILDYAEVGSCFAGQKSPRKTVTRKNEALRLERLAGLLPENSQTVKTGTQFLPIYLSAEKKMKRIEVTARRPSLGTLFRISFLSAFGFAFFLLAVALPFAKIDPELTATRLIFGVIGLLTIWPIAVACGFSVGGWLLFALVGKKRKFRFTFVCDDQDSIPAVITVPIQSATAQRP